MEKLLTFEFDNVTREIELIVNKIGAKYMIDILEDFINNDKNEHTHLLTKEWGKGDLSSEKQNLDENVELINLVTVRYFKDDE